jgi:hypothetical protein
MRNGVLKKLFSEKHASLSLSINAIVVLIMAITMLGLGLAFMKNSMGSTMKQFSNVNEDIKAQMIKDLQESPGRLTFKGEDVKFKQGEKREMYFAIKNDQLAADTFKVNVTCSEGMVTGNAELKGLTLQTFSVTPSVEPNKIAVAKMTAAVSATIKPDTYSCLIVVKNSTNVDIYEQKKFYLTVE